jgi:hypothetical protein
LDFRPDLDSCLLALPRLEIVGAFIALVRPAKPCQPAATLLANRKAWIDRQWTVQHQGSRVSLLALAGIRAVGTRLTAEPRQDDQRRRPKSRDFPQPSPGGFVPQSRPVPTIIG